MKLVYGITVSTEVDEIKRLIKLIKNHTDDIIVVQYDSTKTPDEILQFLKNEEVVAHPKAFQGDFSEFKNSLNDLCLNEGADYIYQLDADEQLTPFILNNIKAIIEENPEVDLYFIPRINRVEGLTDNHINKWRWQVNTSGWVNFPDWQGRIYRSNLKWRGRVPERIHNPSKYATLPTDEEYCIIHNKTIDKQERQNNLYDNL
jgi:glycosyltransferase involved in cell wall biosynthesis